MPELAKEATAPEPAPERPSVDANGVGWCDDACPEHDGKRCRLTGFRPRGICEPWAVRLAGPRKP